MILVANKFIDLIGYYTLIIMQDQKNCTRPDISYTKSVLPPTIFWSRALRVSLVTPVTPLICCTLQAENCVKNPIPPKHVWYARHPGPPKLRFGMTGPQKRTDPTPFTSITPCEESLTVEVSELTLEVFLQPSPSQTLPKTNSFSLKNRPSKRKGSSPNHHFWGWSC